MLHYFLQGRGCKNLDALNQLALGSIFLGNEDFLGAKAFGLHNHGKYTGDLADAAIQGELTHKNLVLQFLRINKTGAGQKADGNGQIQAGALLTQICRCQIDGDFGHGKGIIAVTHGGLNSFLGLPHGHGRQAYQIKIGETVGNIHLYQNHHAINTTGS